MLTSHALLRHLMDDYSIETLLKEQANYLKVLTLMHDNVDGRLGAFSIQNIARMSLIYNKYPGEWHGPGSISNVFRDLNKLYQPVDDFQIVHFSDGMIYLDKITKAAHLPPRKYLINLMQKQDLSEEKLFKMQQMHALFKKYTGTQTVDDLHLENSSAQQAADQEEDDEFFFDNDQRRESSQSESQQAKWRNGVLVLISNRLGLRQM